MTHPRKQADMKSLKAIDDERLRLGNTLHDEFGQCLVGVSLMLANLMSRLEKRCPEEVPRVMELRSLIKETTNKMRVLSIGLRKSSLDPSEIASSLENFVIDVGTLRGLECEVAISPQLGDISKFAAEQLYALTYDLLDHAILSANPKEIHVDLQQVKESLELRLEYSASSSKNSPVDTIALGLAKYRVGILGGELNIELSEEGKNRCCCTIPAILEY